MDEQWIIQNCIEGNPIAQRKLFETFAPKMMAVCIRYFNNVQEAEDVLQEGFVKVFQNIKNYEKSGSFEGWLRKIIVNTALDQLRRNAKFGFSADIEEISYNLDYSNTSTVYDQLNAEDLMNLVQQMPEGYKVVFNLFAIEGYSHKEIGQMLNISKNTSKSQYSRARTFLMKKLEKIEIGTER